MANIRQIEAGRAVVRVGLDRSELRDGLANVGTEVQKIGKRVAAAGAFSIAIGVGLAAPLNEATQAAGNFEETLNRFEATFGELSGSTREFAVGFADAANRSEREILDALSSFQAFFVGLEFGTKESAKLSTSITQLAQDFGSFNNLDTEEANQRFISALSGSSEVVDKFGINLKQAALEQELLRQGFRGSFSDASEQQKVLARLSIIYRSLGRQGAIGDAIKTSDSFVNSQRGVEAAFDDIQIAIGKAITPLRAEFNGTLIGSLRIVRDFIRGNQELVVTIAKVATVATVGGAALVGLGGVLLAGGAAMGLLARTGGRATNAVLAVGAAGSSLGNLFVKLKSVIALPFLLLAKTASGAIAGIGFVGKAMIGILNPIRLVTLAVGGLTTGVAFMIRGFVLFIGAVGVVPALILAVAAGLIFLNSQTRTVEQLKDEFKDMATILGGIAALIVTVGRGIERVLRPLFTFSRVGRGLLAEVLRGNITSVNDFKKFIVKTAPDVREAVGDIFLLDDDVLPTEGELRDAADKLLGEVDDAATSDSRESLKDRVKEKLEGAAEGAKEGALELGEKVKEAIPPGVKDAFDQVVASVDESIPGVKAKLAELAQLFAGGPDGTGFDLKLPDIGDAKALATSLGLEFDGIGAQAQAAFERVKTAIDEAKGAAGEDFAGGLAKDFSKTLKELQKRAAAAAGPDDKAAKKRRRELLKRARQAARALQQASENIKVQVASTASQASRVAQFLGSDRDENNNDRLESLSERQLQVLIRNTAALQRLGRI